MTSPDSTYAKPFLTVPEQIRRLRSRGIDCGDDAYAADVLERYGYYRLSGYWHLYRERPAPPEPQFDEDGREVRLDTFVPGANLAHVVALYEFDHGVRVRLGDVLSGIETAFRFYVGHRLGRVDKFAHRKPEILGAMREVEQHLVVRAWGALSRRPQSPRAAPTKAYREWLEEYDRHERRARGDFVAHFRQKYGPHLPIWVATEVMSFGVLSNLYGLMRQSDQEILAARFQVRAADGRGDRGALGNWLNSLRNVRNICAHYGRVWNRAFDVLLDAPGQARKNDDDLLARLTDDGTKNRLYGVLLVMRYLMLSIEPENIDVVDLVDFIERRSHALGFGMAQLGFPDDWKENPIWGRTFVLDRSPMLAASLLDRTDCLSAPKAREALTTAEPSRVDGSRTPAQLTAAKRAAQKSLLRTYLKYRVVIEVELGETKFYPAFQFRDGKIIDALAEVNKELVARCEDADPAKVARALLDWWQTPHPGLPGAAGGKDRSPLDLLWDVSEYEFEAAVREAGALSSFVVPERRG